MGHESGKNDSLLFMLGKPMQCSHSNSKKLTSVHLEIIVILTQFTTGVMLDALFFLLNKTSCCHHACFSFKSAYQQKCWTVLQKKRFNLFHSALQSDKEKEGKDTFLEDPCHWPLHHRNQRLSVKVFSQHFVQQ